MTDSAPYLPARLMQLVARFRPDVDGVGEFALRLADVLWDDHRLPSDFLVCNPPHPGASLAMPGNFPHTVTHLDGAGSARMAAALDRLAGMSAAPHILLVHYASYGYSRHGTPIWLAKVLERFVRGGGRVLTVFHELWARGRFPSRTFFTSELQRRIFRRVLALSQAAFTSSEEYVAIAQQENPRRRPVTLVGICSNAGEPEYPRPLAQRARRLAVFGRFTTRKRLYALHLATLERLARHLGIEEIADIGEVEDPAWMEKNVFARLGPQIRIYGMLPVDAVSRLLEDSIAGAVSYSHLLLGKSGVVAAYQAHAMAIVLFPESTETPPAERPDAPRDPASWILTAGELLALPAASLQLFDRMQQSASAAHQHYRRFRSAHSIAQTLLPALRGVRVGQ